MFDALEAEAVDDYEIDGPLFLHSRDCYVTEVMTLFSAVHWE